MKLSKITIKNLFGIQELELAPGDIELLGANGTGKTSIIDALRLGMSNKSPRDYIIRNGETQGEIIIESDTGVIIRRLYRASKGDYSTIKVSGEKGYKTEAWLREFFSEIQLNPVDFLFMPEEQQNRIILDLIDFHWDLNWIIQQFGEIVPMINYEQNILGVLHDIQAENGYYFTKRQEINREIKANQAVICEIADDLPKDYNPEHWKKIDLAERFKQIEAVRAENSRIESAKRMVAERDAKARGLEAGLRADKAAVEQSFEQEKNICLAKIRELETEILAIQQTIKDKEFNKTTQLQTLDHSFEKALAALDSRVEENRHLITQELVDIVPMQMEAQHILAMKEYANESERIQRLSRKNDELIVESNKLTQKIELARALPVQILEKSNIPIKNITVENGIPLINGLPINNLSEGEKLDLCVDVATMKTGQLNILLIDGVEKLSNDNRSRLYAKLKERGVQFFATRTTDDKSLLIVEV